MGESRMSPLGVLLVSGQPIRIMTPCLVRLGSSLLALPALSGLGALCAIGAPALADYSTSAGDPTVLYATASDDVQPKVGAAPEGGMYVCFLSGSGYDVMVIRLDESGNAVWSAPVVVEDRTLSSTTDYGFAVDAQGNTFFAFDSTSPQGIKFVSLDPSGAVRWSRQVYSGSGALLARCTVASDGAAWISYLEGSSTKVQRYTNADGTATLPTPVALSESGATQAHADLQPSLDGAIIASCVRYTTFTGAKTLRAHRINADGSRPWTAVGVPVFTTGSLQFGNYPSFIPDGAGGAYFCWYATSPLQCHAQRITFDGVVLYGTSGIAVTSTTTGANRVSPSMTLGADGRLYVFWSQNTPNTSIYGVFGQCFAKGVRQWGAGGVAVEPLASTYSRSWATAARVGDGVVCFYDDSTGATQDNLECARMNADGTVAWRSDVAVNPGTKYRHAARPAAGDGAAIVWQGSPSAGGASDLWAARIGADGVLGPPSAGVVGDLDGDGSVGALDLAILLAQWGGAGSADFDASGAVDALDLAVVLANWT